jgi:perosamine synthetase
LREYLGCRHALAVTSCTTGLEMALRALGIGAGDEVIVPDYTYPATADVVAIVGARIVLVDISCDTMLIDYDALEAAITEQTRAVIPVSLFGNPLDYDRLLAIKEKYGLFVVEDAACSLGAEFKGIKVGNQADIAVFSCHPRKFITTGEGGIIVTHNPDWAEWMDSYKHFGMSSHGTRLGANFARIGANYKLSNLLAAVGLGQMRKVDELLMRRIELADNYITMLQGISKITLPRTTSFGKHSWQSFCIFIEPRDSVMEDLRQNGIEVQIGTYALHLHPPFFASATCRHAGSMSASKYAFDHCLTLPLYHDLTLEDQETVVGELLKRL